MISRRTRGFTLVEMMVAISIFAIVMMIASGAYLIMLSADNHAHAESVGINNLSYALDSMTRNIRTGRNYDCGAAKSITTATPNDCPTSGPGDDSFGFTNQKGYSVVYWLNGSTIDETVTTSSGTNTYPLTEAPGGAGSSVGSGVEVQKLEFYVDGAQPLSAGNQAQPQVVILVQGRVKVGPNTYQNFSLQTAATMRGLDL